MSGKEDKIGANFSLFDTRWICVTYFDPPDLKSSYDNFSW